MDRIYRFYSWEFRGSQSSYEAISVEFEDKTNNAVLYSETQRDEHKTSIQSITNDDCSYTYHAAAITETVTTRIAVKFKVDEDTYTLSEVYSADDEPTYYAESIKYYNTDNIAAKSALLGADVFTGAEQENYEYYYVGPNSKNELVKTEFPGDYATGTHTIPDILVDGVPLEFDGKVFLGRIDYVMQL